MAVSSWEVLTQNNSILCLLSEKCLRLRCIQSRPAKIHLLMHCIFFRKHPSAMLDVQPDSSWNYLIDEDKKIESCSLFGVGIDILSENVHQSPKFVQSP